MIHNIVRVQIKNGNEYKYSNQNEKWERNINFFHFGCAIITHINFHNYSFIQAWA